MVFRTESVLDDPTCSFYKRGDRSWCHIANGRHSPAEVVCFDPLKWIHVTKEAKEGNCPGPPDQEGVSGSAHWCDLPGTAPVRASGGETLYSDPSGGLRMNGRAVARGRDGFDCERLCARGDWLRVWPVTSDPVDAAPALGPLVTLHRPPCSHRRAGQGLPGLVGTVLRAGASCVDLTSTSRRPADARLVPPHSSESWASSSLPQWPSLCSEAPHFLESQPRRETLRVFCWEDLR